MKRRLIRLFATNVFDWYIRFVYASSKIEKRGDFNLIHPEQEEKYLIGFWHGDSYCYYPLLKGQGYYIITTMSYEGDTIEQLCHRFGYQPIRLPDEGDGKSFIFQLRETINGKDKRCLALTLDGPLGPIHEPKMLALLTAQSVRRKIIPLAVSVKRKIVLKKRWDKYVIPLPFNHMTFTLHDPIAVDRKDMEGTTSRIRECLL